jgi:hypothetical protein
VLAGRGPAVDLGGRLARLEAEPNQQIARHGQVTPTAFDTIAQAFDIHWHLRDMPCN